MNENQYKQLITILDRIATAAESMAETLQVADDRKVAEDAVIRGAMFINSIFATKRSAPKDTKDEQNPCHDCRGVKI